MAIGVALAVEAGVTACAGVLNLVGNCEIGTVPSQAGATAIAAARASANRDT